MHGLINKAIQSFVSDSYGGDTWATAAKVADLEFTEFEAMWMYDDTLTSRVLGAVSQVLKRPQNDVLEDIGTYLVSHPNVEPLRRLLRFGGVDFAEFLSSLDDLPDRARLAVSDLQLPDLTISDRGDHQFTLICKSESFGFGHVMVGILRAMADDYGALAFLEHEGTCDAVETISITLVETEFAEGRVFELAAKSA